MTLWLALGLMVTTYVSEDAALVGAAVLARNESVPALLAATAVAVGIWSGDVALFAAGRLARRWAPVARWVDRRWPPARLAALGSTLDRGAALSILLSRLTPGTRLPLYVAAGVLSVRTRTFVTCTAVAAAGWTATIVLGASWLR